MTVAALVIFARRVKRAGGRAASIAIHSTFGTQIIVGIATVTTGVAIGVAALHQAVGALVVAATVWGAHVAGRDEMSVVSVYCTFANAEEAERIGRQLVEERLAACINILGPCRSIYRWQGKVETAEEVAAIFKTTADAAERLTSRIAELHSYDVPAIAVWPTDGVFGPYEKWVDDSVG